MIFSPSNHVTHLTFLTQLTLFLRDLAFSGRPPRSQRPSSRLSHTLRARSRTIQASLPSAQPKASSVVPVPTSDKLRPSSKDSPNSISSPTSRPYLSPTSACQSSRHPMSPNVKNKTPKLQVQSLGLRQWGD